MFFFFTLGHRRVHVGVHGVRVPLPHGVRTRQHCHGGHRGHRYIYSFKFSPFYNSIPLFTLRKVDFLTTDFAQVEIQIHSTYIDKNISTQYISPIS